MSLPSFLSLLFEHGRIRVPEYAPIGEEEVAGARGVLVDFEPEYRRTLPGAAPEFLVETACWSAAVLYRTCQCLVYRELEVQHALPALKTPCSGSRLPAHHYSADVVLRFLPDAWRLARDVASADPLLKHLHELAGSWPLSSVGMPEVKVEHPDEFVEDRCLLRLYADRIIDRQDRSRLDDPRVRSAVDAAIGLFPELAPDMANSLRTPDV